MNEGEYWGGVEVKNCAPLMYTSGKSSQRVKPRTTLNGKVSLNYFIKERDHIMKSLFPNGAKSTFHSFEKINIF